MFKFLLILGFIPSLALATCFKRPSQAPEKTPKEICLEEIIDLPKNFVRIMGKKDGVAFNETSRASLPKEMYAPGVSLREASLSYQKIGTQNCFEKIIEVLVYWKTLKGQKTKILLQPLVRETKALSPCGGDFETSEYPYIK